MDWQLLAVSGIVLTAVAYLARQTWRTWSRKKSGCGGSCGCASSPPASSQPTFIPLEQLGLRRSDPGPR
jgi:hypothetical protein